jgi:hypothetical protein
LSWSFAHVVFVSGGLTPVARQSSSIDPASSVLPSSLSATAAPIESWASAFEALIYACCVHVLPLRVKT